MTASSTDVRASGIGSSEIAAIVGLSPWGDPWTVYAQKHHLIENDPPTPEMEWGTLLQPVIANKFSKFMNLPIEWWDKMVRHKERPWQFCSPDAWVLTQPQRRILEVKTAGLHQSGHWSRDMTNVDGIPDYYAMQVIWQLSVCELEMAYVAVLIAGSDFRVYEVERDPEMEQILLEEAEDFWENYVLTATPPPPGPSRRAREYLQRRFPRERERIRPAQGPELEWAREYVQVRRSLSPLLLRKKELENQITQAIGDAEGIKWGEDNRITWRKTADVMGTNWEKMAKHLMELEDYSESEIDANLSKFYEMLREGSRRIYCHSDEEDE